MGDKVGDSVGERVGDSVGDMVGNSVFRGNKMNMLESRKRRAVGLLSASRVIIFSDIFLLVTALERDSMPYGK